MAVKKHRTRKAKPGGVSQLVKNEPGCVCITLPIRIESESNKASSEHWRKRHARSKSQKEELQVEWLSLVGKVQVPLPCTVTFTRLGAKPIDSGNIETSFKYLQDGMAAIIGVDDGDPRITWRYRQSPDGVRIYKVMVEVRW